MAKKIKGDTLIAPGYSANDWIEDRIELINDIKNNLKTLELWEKAYNHFYQRIKSRFLNPIKWILEKRKDIGEGFSIVALQCILIEFLESLYQGLVYTTSQNPRQFEYSSSRKLFRDFLLNHKPFSDYFTTTKLAYGFYDNIRCGLLHEARTKESSLIRKTSPDGSIIEIMNDRINIILYRDNFYNALKIYIDDYKRKLLESKDLKVNFIRKFDDLVDIKRVIYFAYGSNMCKRELIEKKRIKYHSASKALLENYRFIYNKKSTKDGTAKANIEECEREKVWGVCYEIDEDDFTKLQGIEKGYETLNVMITLENYQNDVSAKTFKAKSKFKVNSIAPSEDYRQKILKGAEEWDLPKEYIEEYLKK